MLFKAKGAQSLFQGRIGQDPRSGATAVIDHIGGVYLRDEVEFVIPDNEEQGTYVRTLGYRIHTPMSMELGPGTTCLE